MFFKNRAQKYNQVLGTSLTLTNNVEGGTELEFDDFRLYVSVVKE